MQLCLFRDKFQPTERIIKYKIAVLDIDGTMTNDDHRKHLMPKFKTDNPKDYQAYQNACVDDKVNYDLQGKIAECGYDCIIVATSRQSNFLITTFLQISSYSEIAENIIWFGMRGENDTSKSIDIKNHTIDCALRKILKYQPNAAFDVDVYDDRHDVLNGIICTTKNVASFKKFLVVNGKNIKEL